MDMKEILEYRNSQNRFCNRLGIVLTELAPGYARAVKTIEEGDLNALNVAHGGVYFTMADNVSGSAMAAYGHQAVTLDAHYSYFRSATLGDVLTAEARESKHGETICVFEVTITDQEARLIGGGTFTFFDQKKPLKIPES